MLWGRGRVVERETRWVIVSMVIVFCSREGWGGEEGMSRGKKCIHLVVHWCLSALSYVGYMYTGGS